METFPADPVQRQRVAHFVAMFGVDADSPEGQALVSGATDGVPLQLPEPTPIAPAVPTRPAPEVREQQVVEPDVAAAATQRAALANPTAPKSPSPTPVWVTP